MNDTGDGCLMKQERSFPHLTVTLKAERSIQGGHPWVYGTEITSVEDYQNGSLVDVFGRGDRWLGTGFVNDHSKIMVRLISRNANDNFDDAFFERRLSYAIRYRKTVMAGQYSCCRLIFGDSDQFPGLVVDRFDDVLVVQILSLGMERLKSRLLPMLYRLMQDDGQKISGIYERNDSGVRALEGMGQYKAEFPLPGVPSLGERHTALISENGINYEVDFVDGQKTGFFLDQKYNRQAVAKIASGHKVLDCFTHTGSFALNAVAGGAESALAVDVSEEALQQAQRNAELNHMKDKVQFQKADVFELLTTMVEKGRNDYDLIILDPPAFTKSRQTLPQAIGGYREINLKAMQLLPRGGYLATCSCSHFFSDDLFRETLSAAAKDAKVSLRQIERRSQSPDHPILWGVPETDYLKFYLFQVV